MSGTGKQDVLRRLIKTLDASEKRYFQRFAKRYRDDGDSGLQRLFNQIVKSPSLNDADLQAKLGYKNASALSVAKYQLFGMLMHALRNFHADIQNNGGLLNELLDIRQLSNRGLFDLAYKKLQKVQHKAVEQEEFEIQLLCVREQLNLFYRIYKPTEFAVQRVGIVNNYQSALSHCEINFQLMERIMAINEVKLVKGIDRKGEAEAFVKKILDHDILKSAEGLKTNAAKSSYYAVHRTACDLLHDMEGYMHNARKIAVIALEELEGKRKNKTRPLMGLAIYCEGHALTDRKRDSFYDQCREKLKSMEIHSRKKLTTESRRYLLIPYRSDIELSIRDQQYDEAAEMADEAMKAARRDPEAFTGQTYSLLTVTSCLGYFVAGRYEDALAVIYDLTEERHGQYREDAYVLARIMELICHLELKNYRLVQARATSLKRFFREQGSGFRSEKVILRYLTKLANLPDVPDYAVPIWNEFGEELSELYEDGLEKDFLDQFNFKLHWIDRRPIRKEVIKTV